MSFVPHEPGAPHTDADDLLIGVPMAALADDAAPEEEFVKKRLGWGFWVSIAWLVVIIGLALLAPVLPIDDPQDPASQFVNDPRQAPSAEAWFGSDELGRDVFSQVIYGARVSLTVGIAAIAFGLIVGGTMGIMAGFLRGRTDSVVSAFFVVMLAFPPLVLAILITATLERKLIWIALTLGILAVAPVGRLARANTLAWSEREFVTAARSMGAKSGRIMVREILPNVLIPMGALALLGMALAIVAEGGLAFLALSVPPDEASSWGNMISRGTSGNNLEDMPWLAFAPIIAMFLTVLALNFAGDRVREYFDVKDLAL